MAYYRYKVINEAGRYVTGNMAAENPSDLTTVLRKNGLELISYRKERENSIRFLSKVKVKDLITVFIHLEQLERAGVSIVDSISDLRDTTDSPKIKNLMNELHESIKNGNLFSESLAKRSDIFNPVHIGLITMGEKTGSLADSFASIVEDLKWSSEIKRKTRKAITGPAFGLFMVMIVVGIMTGVVVPKVTGFIVMQGMALPTATRTLIGFSDFVSNYWPFLLFSIPVFWIGLKILGKIPAISVSVDNFKIKIPVFGPIISKIDSAKFCQFFAMTFKSGLGVIECLESSSSVLKNAAIKQSIEIVKQQVSDGKSLASSLAEVKYFPNLVVRMFKVGEESGNMENSLQNIKFFYDREINDSIDKVVAMIQPTLTIIMGGMIAWIAIAVFGPIYSTFGNF